MRFDNTADFHFPLHACNTQVWCVCGIVMCVFVWWILAISVVMFDASPLSTPRWPWTVTQQQRVLPHTLIFQRSERELGHKSRLISTTECCLHTVQPFVISFNYCNIRFQHCAHDEKSCMIWSPKWVLQVNILKKENLTFESNVQSY